LPVDVSEFGRVISHKIFARELLCQTLENPKTFDPAAAKIGVQDDSLVVEMLTDLAWL
jgi:hypothetical protein